MTPYDALSSSLEVRHPDVPGPLAEREDEVPGAYQVRGPVTRLRAAVTMKDACELLSQPNFPRFS